MKRIHITIATTILLMLLAACSNNQFPSNSSNIPHNSSQITSSSLHIHTFTPKIIPPTCLNAGYTLYQCACGTEYKEHFTDAINHNWQAPTCIDPQICTICGSTQGVANGHSWISATCTSAKICSICQASEGNPIGHKWEVATCTNPMHCSVCGKPEGNALGHNYIDGKCVNCMEPDPSISIKEFEKIASISTTILYNENNIKISATELIYGYSGVEIKLLFENQTAYDLTFVSGSLGYCSNSINGFMMYTGYENMDVTAGNQGLGSIRFDYSELLLNGIYAVADIELDFYIHDDDYTLQIKTGPMTFETSIKDQYIYDYECYQKAVNSIGLQNHLGYSVLYFNSEKLYENNNVSIISACMMENKYGEIALALEVVNNTNIQLNFKINDIMLNGLNISWGTWTTDTINPGKHCVISINLSDVLDKEFIPILDIANIASIGFSVAQVDLSYNNLADEQRIIISIPDSIATFDTTGTEVYNKNGIRIISKGLVLEESAYSNDIYLVLLVQNNAGTTINTRDEYNSLSVNGTMFGLYSCTDIEIPDGEWGLIKITLWSSSLEDLGIENIQDISTIEITLRFRENYTDIDVSKIKFDFIYN